MAPLRQPPGLMSRGLSGWGHQPARPQGPGDYKGNDMGMTYWFPPPAVPAPGVWQVYYGELKLATDANDGAFVDIGQTSVDQEYFIFAWPMATPSGLPAWQNSFFRSVAIALGGGSNSRFSIDIGAGETLLNVPNGGTLYFANSLLTPIVPAMPIFSDVISGSFTIRITAARRMEKQWTGFGGGLDYYLIILSRNV